MRTKRIKLYKYHELEYNSQREAFFILQHRYNGDKTDMDIFAELKDANSKWEFLKDGTIYTEQ